MTLKRTSPRRPQLRKPLEVSCFIAVDPGLNTGVALFEQSPSKYYLTHATVYCPDDHACPLRVGFGAIVCEIPDHVRVPPLDLVMTGIRAGRAIGDLRAVPGPVELIPVKEWKKSHPKAWVHDELRKVLSPLELEICESLDHNGLDAVALGMWRAGRLRL